MATTTIAQTTPTLTPAAPPASMSEMFERLARDERVDVDKLERLLQMYERTTSKRAEEEFNAAMARAQQAMRPVAADAENPQTRSRYASHAALDKALRPIYTTHGFALSFDTGTGALENWIRLQCFVTHAGGYARTYHVDMPADGVGAKGGQVMTRTHAVGAAMSYGMRYLLRLIFNVAIGEDDRDGNEGGRVVAGRIEPAADMVEPPDPPKGFESWLLEMRSAADEGLSALQTAWNASRADHKRYMSTVHGDIWTAMKASAAAVKVSG